MEFSIDAASAGSYLVKYRVASLGGSHGFETLIDGIQIDSQSITNTGG
ncbi:MAG: hypothetical protein NZ730_11165 [Porticoccaceae bacterium]|nr:hypothetical protein [Porticoccaceae bacterium]